MDRRFPAILLGCSYADCPSACLPEEDDGRDLIMRAELETVCFDGFDHEPPHFELDTPVGITPVEDQLLVDFDGDGMLDVVGFWHTWSLFRGRGDGTFEKPVDLIGKANRPREFWAAEVDGDGAFDVVALDTNDFYVWSNRGDSLVLTSRFAIPGSDDGWSDPQVHVADLDGDGQSELLFASDEGLQSLVLSPEGELVELRDLVPNRPDLLSPAQLDADSADEILLVNGDALESIDPSSGTSVLTTLVASVVDEQLDSITVGDMDGDGMDEALLGTHAYGSTADGSWAPRVAVAPLTREEVLGTLRLADVDGDGRKDIVAIRDPGFDEDECGGGPSAPGALQFFVTGGPSAFVEFEDSFMYSNLYGFADLDSDGREDLFLPYGIALAHDCE